MSPPCRGIAIDAKCLKGRPEQEIHTGDNAKEANQWLVREQRKPDDDSFIA